MVSAGSGPRAWMPRLRKSAIAGATISSSSVPSVPNSPACGLSPEIARRGLAMPKRDFRSATAMRAVAVIISLVSRAIASRKGTWMVTGTTASVGDQSIITGCGTRPSRPASSARNSVWPGCLKPARYNTLLAMGLVTTALARPDMTSPTAWRIEASTASALEPSGRPGAAVAGFPVATTGKALAKAAPASSAETSAKSACTPRCLARSAKKLRSPSR